MNDKMKNPGLLDECDNCLLTLRHCEQCTSCVPCQCKAYSRYRDKMLRTNSSVKD